MLHDPAAEQQLMLAELSVTLHTRLKQEEADRRPQCNFRPVCSTVSQPGAHRCSKPILSKTKRKEVLIGARGYARHTGLSELF